MYVSQERAHEFVRSSARVRVHSGAIGCENLVMAEGRVVSYCAAPSLTIEHDDGTRSTWSVDLPIRQMDPDHQGCDACEGVDPASCLFRR